jgi:Zn-dependent M28 family amino/carboxypeptidase
MHSNKKYYSIVLTLCLLLISQAAGLAQEDSLSPSAERLMRHVKTLASDEFGGRLPGTPGIAKAADYIINQYKEFGLEPVGGDYRQTLDVVTGVKLGADNLVKFDVIIPRPGLPEDMWKSVEKRWKTGVNWQPLGFSDEGSVSGEMVFCGYGITNKAAEYDDYAGIDVKDKIVIVLTDSPDKEEKLDIYDRYESLRYKASNARQNGAKAIIFVKEQGDSANVFFPLEKSIAGSGGIIAIQASRTDIAKFFPKKEPLFPAEEKINKEQKPHSFDIPRKKIHIKVDLEEIVVETSNIIGMIEGSDSELKDQYIVIGAHYDHLGMGKYNSLWSGQPKVHNGADDNASGVAGVLELARRISEKPIRRSVLFMAFTGEEMGLKGSHYYVNNPLVPLEKTVAMMNMDMIGRLTDTRNLNVFGVGSSADFAEMIEKMDEQDTLLTITEGDEAFSPSDNSSFYSKDIPVLFFFTGVHGDYHTPDDDWDKLNYTGHKQVIDFIENAVRNIDSDDEKPEFTRVKVEAEEGRTMKKGSGAWFGIVPNFEKNPHGAKISGTSAGSPAEKAGLKANDVIVEFGGNKVKNLYDLTFALREHKPGDEVKVVIIRNNDPDNKITFNVTLASRK